MLRRFSLPGLLCALAFLVPACTGGGGGGTPSSTSSLSLFMSDGFSQDYSQVWMTLFSVELRDAATGDYTSVYSDSTGVLFDAERLHDGEGPRYSFLQSATVTPGTYDQVRVTLLDQVSLVPEGSTTAETKTFDSALPRDGSGHVQVAYSLDPNLVLTQSSALREVIDFDLAHFTINGAGEVVPSLGRGVQVGIEDENRHEMDDYFGTVSNLTGASFDLTRKAGQIQVQYDATTPIFSSSTGMTEGLANGQRVEVSGVFSTTSNALVASAIKIQDPQQDHAEVRGAVGSVDLVANTMTLSDVFMADGFVPQSSTVDVSWTDATVFRSGDQTVDETYLNTSHYAEVQGSYDPSTNTLLATRICLEDGDGHGMGEVALSGTSTSVDLTANTLVLTNVHEAERYVPLGGSDSVNVDWTDTTVFRRGGDLADESWLSSISTLIVRGTYDGTTNTLHATTITLVDATGWEDGGGDAVQAAGTIGSVDLGANTMVLSSLEEVEGFMATSVNVAWTDKTIFDLHGTLTDESALTSHTLAAVTGTYDSATNTLTATAIKIIN